MLNLLNANLRKKIIEETTGNENKNRKKLSNGQWEIFKDRIYQQVKAYLQGFYSLETIENTPIVSSVNLARRIVKKEASLYKKKPKRTFINMGEEQVVIMEKIYQDMNLDSVMNKSNEYYKLQEQNHVYIIPRNKKLKACPLLSHQIDVVPSSQDQEMGEVYMIDGFNKINANVKVSDYGDNENQLIADEDDWQAGNKAIAWWSPIFNFVSDQDANILPAASIENPLGGLVPFVDIHTSKDGEYWVRSGASITDFTIQFNAGLTDMGNIVRMQGFGQAWLKAPKELMPENIQIGPNFILRLPIDPNSETSTDFGFANANPDIAGSMQYLEGLLSSFLTSRGVDPKVINAKMESTKYASGFERLLAMIEQFEASEEDISVFENAEKKIFKIVVAYLNAYAGSDILPDYKIGQIPDDADVQILYAKPQSVLSEKEKLDNIQIRNELGLIDPIEAIALDREITYDEAQVVYDRIEKMKPKLPEQEPLNG